MSVTSSPQTTVFILPTPNAANTSYLVPNNTRLYDPATGAINPAVNSLGMYFEVPNSSSPNAIRPITAAQKNKAFRFIQRINFAGIGPIPSRQFRESEWINPHNGILELSATEASIGNYQVTYLDMSTIVPTESNDFTITTSISGPAIDMYGGMAATQPGKVASYRSPNFLQMNMDEEAARDLIIQNLAIHFNDNSTTVSNSTIALVVTSNAPANGQTIAQLAALPIGDRVIVGYDMEGQPVVMVIDQRLKDTLALVPAPQNGMFLLPYVDPAANVANSPASAAITAGDVVPAGTQGTTIAAEGLLFITGHTRMLPYDAAVGFHERFMVGMAYGWGESHTPRGGQIIVPASDDFGRSNRVYWETLVMQDYKEGDFGVATPWGSYTELATPNGLVKGGYYDCFIVGGQTRNWTSHGQLAGVLQRVYIYIPNTTVGGSVEANANYTGTANPDRAALLALLNSYNTINEGGFDTLV